MKLDFNDLLIVPKETSDINTRTKINPYWSYGVLPIITAPMDTVVSLENADEYEKNKILICLPRNVRTHSPFAFNSYSLYEIHNFIFGITNPPPKKVLIDVANGHMKLIADYTKKFKEAFPNTQLMVGNVANPETYRVLSDAGADLVRIGIGNGNGCLTTQNTGIGYPMASLIKECYDISLTLKEPALIVADGGMKDYSDIIKALALGADLVMIGSIFNKSLESSGENYLWGKVRVAQKIANWAYKHNIPVYKNFRGMSTKEVQKKWGNTDLKTSEGVVRKRRVEYTLAQWTENFEHYLRSAMSYVGAHDLKEFIGRANIVQITSNAYKRFNK